MHSPWDSGAGKIRTFIFASYFTETKCNFPLDAFQEIVIKCIHASVAPAFVGHTVLGVGVIVVLLADLSEAFIAGE